MRKIAIVGYSPSSREDAPFDDPTFELWGMNNLHSELPGKRWDRWFDMHKLDYIHVNNGSLQTDHIAWLKMLEIPVYMLAEHDEFQMSVRYPIEEIQERMRNEWGFEPGEENYFHSGVAYQIALALHEGVDEIHIYGVDMVKDAEWSYQRPNLEGWLCLARQQSALSGGKVRVVVAKNCALMKGLGLYGYQDKEYALPIKFERAFFTQKNELMKQKNEAWEELQAAQRKYNTIDGYVQNSAYWLGRVSDIKRGAEP
jgi:hypothetical protein